MINLSHERTRVFVAYAAYLMLIVLNLSNEADEICEIKKPAR